MFVKYNEKTGHYDDSIIIPDFVKENSNDYVWVDAKNMPEKKIEENEIEKIINSNDTHITRKEVLLLLGLKRS